MKNAQGSFTGNGNLKQQEKKLLPLKENSKMLKLERPILKKRK
jgi:hypothetical protein